MTFPIEKIELPSLSAAEAMLEEQDVLGLSTGDHIMTFFRQWLEAQGILDSEKLNECPNGRWVQVAGLIVVHQAPPTAKGHHFLTLEDEMGLINVIVRPKIYDQHHRILRDSRLLIISGKVQQADGVTSLLARRIYALQT